ncbi:discoidin domain-containing protein [Demequina sp. NBRC 110054]|uniref:discoidin domain-containing protein n=1 Tax=Demequina sp. NBRC 110054 TaxID=1570343 RepID=UPI0009FC95E1|nr:discoidin domain-containing protein [Demequina sp. NBRC 110054]
MTRGSVASLLTGALAGTLLASVPAVAVADTATHETFVDRSGWTVTASETFEWLPIANMIDGALGSGWSTGQAQSGGEWIQIDAGAAIPFHAVDMATGAAVSDYARAYEIAYSLDGVTWSDPVAGDGVVADGSVRAEVCDSADPCWARYVRIEQTGTADNWWVIDELNLVSTSSEAALDRSSWTIAASDTYEWLPLANLVDDDLGTGWSTGKAQVGDEWLEIDAGAQVTFDAIDMATGSATEDYAHGILFSTSTDGVTWEEHFDSYGTVVDGSVRLSFCDDLISCEPITARYVRIEQTSTADNWWTVAELNLILGDLSYAEPAASLSPRWALIGDGTTLAVSGLAAGEPVAALSEDGATLVHGVADSLGNALLTIPAAEQLGWTTYAVSGAWTGWSEEVDLKVVDQAPLGVVEVESLEHASGTLALDWTAIEGASAYEVYRSTGLYSDYSLIGTVAATEYVDAVDDADRYSFYYEVVAVSDTNESLEPSEPVSLESELFGDTMHIFSETDATEEVDAVIAEAADELVPFESELSEERVAFAFKPGEYDTADIEVGYYTSVYGLGETPMETTVPSIYVGPNQWNSLTNFWRSVENIGIDTGSEANQVIWGVSQAAPTRRLWVNGTLLLHEYKAASGGFLADSVVTGATQSGPQQQYLLRNNEFEGGWSDGVWNIVFVGNEGEPDEPEDWTTGTPYTVEDTTDVIREKPFLYLDDSGDYAVFVPGVREDSTGVSWYEDDMGEGESISIDDFYVAQADADDADSLNAALASGKNLLLTPGIYEVDETLQVDRADTVVLGLGMATIRPTGGVDAMHVADVDGVTIAGLLFDATEDGSDHLLQVGEEGASATHADDPILLADVFVRVGGAVSGSADVSVEINSSDVIGDHFWLWRADHGQEKDATGWDINTAANGLVVNGDRVTVYGLFVEHYQEYQTLWNGDDGATYFYQSEIPYDPPTQADYLSEDGTVNGYASYKVTSEASGHYVTGVGIYDVFIHNDEWVEIENAMEVSPGTEVRHATTVTLGSLGGQNAIVNGVGDTVGTGINFQAKIDSFIAEEPVVEAAVTAASEPSDDGWYAGPATVTLELVSGEGTLQASVDGGEWADYDAPLVISDHGAHTVDYRVVHYGGVYAPASGSVALLVDAEDPVATAVLNPISGLGTPSSPVLLSLAATDVGSGVGEIEYRVEGGAWTAYEGEEVALDEVGMLDVDFRAVDSAGNTGESGTVVAAIVGDVVNESGVDWYRETREFDGVTVAVTTMCSDEGTAAIEVALSATEGAPEYAVSVSSDRLYPEAETAAIVAGEPRVLLLDSGLQNRPVSEISVVLTPDDGHDAVEVRLQTARIHCGNGKLVLP